MRDFSKAKRIVIKIGTNTLTRDNALDSEFIQTMANQVKVLLETGKQVVLVSSGAIGMGATRLGMNEPPREIQMRQACAAIGQPLLMAQYNRAFGQCGVTISQVLVTAEVLDHRKTYLNLRNTIETLLKLNTVPILNENDCVSTDEIGTAFGDNDTLSALVASKIDADLLILLSDIDALYDQDPRKHPDAKPIDTVLEITDEIIQTAGAKGSQFSTGGMKTKIKAAQIASNAGCRMILTNGRIPRAIERIIQGEAVGTIFLPKRRLGNRARWILHSTPCGTIHIDQGASRAIENHKSLLPSGVVSVEGVFESGDVIAINHHAKAVTSLSSVQLQRLIGKHSTEIKKLFGPDQRGVVAIPEDIVFIDR
ncbi:MAG: glutamate 5-kinase [Phycisphaerae bacterium]|nr:glutamate 5-kinase [Phycisphaerae bacterium]